MSAIVEKYYTAQELAFLLGFDRRTIIDHAKAKKFGEGVVNIEGNDWRIPGSGVNAWLALHRVFASPIEPVTARSEGELRRKIGI